MQKQKKRQTIGLIDRGKGSTFIDPSFEGFDVGLRVEGEDHLSVRSRLVAPKINSDKWYEKWLVKYVLLPLLVLIIGAFTIFRFGWN